MKRISTSTRVVNKFGAGKDGYTDGDVVGAIPATDLEAALFDNIQEELANIVEGNGLVLDGSVRTQVLQAIKLMIQSSGNIIGATSGTADAIIGTFSPVPTAAVNGAPLFVRAGVANATATPTFTPNTGVIAPAVIVKGNGLALVAGDIAGAGHWLELQWDAALAKWVLQNPATGVISASGVLPTLFMQGLIASNNATTPLLDVDISVGKCRTIADTFDLANTAIFTKRMTTAWVAGTGNGALDTGSFAASANYHLFIIRLTASGARDFLLSLSPTAPTLPGGYTLGRRIWSFRSTAAAQVPAIYAREIAGGGVDTSHPTPLVVMNPGTPGTASRTLTDMLIPTGVEFICRHRANIADGSTSGSLVITSPMDADVASGSPNNSTVAGTSAGGFGAGEMQTRTNTSAQLGYRRGAGTSNVYAVTQGYVDARLS